MTNLFAYISLFSEIYVVSVPAKIYPQRLAMKLSINNRGPYPPQKKCSRNNNIMIYDKTQLNNYQ